MFLFELYLLFAKEIKDGQGKVKYQYKSRLMTSEIGISEHIEGGDETKLAVWSVPQGPNENRIVLKAANLEAKQQWVKKLRQVIQETCFNSTIFHPHTARLVAAATATATAASSRTTKQLHPHRTSRLVTGLRLEILIFSKGYFTYRLLFARFSFSKIFYADIRKSAIGAAN